MTPLDRIANAIRGRHLELFLGRDTERRVRRFMENVNAELERSEFFGPGDPYDLDEPEEMAVALVTLCQLGLDRDEGQRGLDDVSDELEPEAAAEVERRLHACEERPALPTGVEWCSCCRRPLWLCRCGDGAA